MLDLPRLQRATITTSPIGAVKHEIYNDKGKTGENARELRVGPSHDRYVETSPKDARVGN